MGYYKHTIMLSAIFLFFLIGCKNHYTFNNTPYTTPHEALSAHKEFLDNILSEITPVKQTPNGSAIVVTPSKKTCEALGITRTGHPTPEMINYISTFMEQDFAYFSKFLIKGNIFIDVKHVIDDFPLQHSNNVKELYDAIIYLDMKSPSQHGWFIMVYPDYKSSPIIIDSMAEDGTPKVQSWINSINKKINM